MDSMRPLTNSLPPARRRLDQPELLADFKAAALSVTNLYKTAAAAQDKARAAGYQDAIEDLLSLLDREELGLMDGEGWRVRQWATERLSEEAGGMAKKGPAESDEEVEEDARAMEERSSSPEIQRKAMPATLAPSSSEIVEENPRRSARSEPPPDYSQQPTTTSDFTFRSNQPYPSNHDREAMNLDMDVTSSTPTTPHAHPTSSEATTPASVRIMARANRRGHYTGLHRQRNTGYGNGNGNGNGNGATINLNLGAGAGSKRKLPYSDFFDIDGINFDGVERKDGGGGGNGNGNGKGGGGGKRGRFV